MTVNPASTMVAEVTPLRAGIPAKSKVFSMWSTSVCHDVIPEAYWEV